MKDKLKKTTRVKISKMGGNATLKKYGSAHYSKISKKMWKKRKSNQSK